MSYGRLREACQTDVDGTSIDTIEALANELGLIAEQRIVPSDFLLLEACHALPGLVVVCLPDGNTHFIVAWSQTGLPGGPAWVQCMDPGRGRIFGPRETFLKSLYLHAMPVDAVAWREYAAGEEFIGPLRARLGALGVGDACDALLQTALADPTAHGLATLDAAVRMVSGLRAADAIDRGPACARLVAGLVRDAGAGDPQAVIPKEFWSASPTDPSEEGAAQVLLSGALVVTIRGVVEGDRSAVNDRLLAAVTARQASPWETLRGFLRAEGAVLPWLFGGGLVAAALVTLGEALLFRTVFDVARRLQPGASRLWGALALVGFLLLALVLEHALASAVSDVGRRLEARVRAAFQTALPRLGDRFFSSRPTSDMTERAHSATGLRGVPVLAGRLGRSLAGLVVTNAALAWISPKGALAALLVTLATVALSWLLQTPLRELGMRLRVHAGALTMFYLDALEGLTAIRAHVATRALRRQHEELLLE